MCDRIVLGHKPLRPRFFKLWLVHLHPSALDCVRPYQSQKITYTFVKRSQLFEMSYNKPALKCCVSFNRSMPLTFSQYLLELGVTVPAADGCLECWLLLQEWMSHIFLSLYRNRSPDLEHQSNVYIGRSLSSTL